MEYRNVKGINETSLREFVKYLAKRNRISFSPTWLKRVSKEKVEFSEEIPSKILEELKERNLIEPF
jgi:hypothetical protein